MKRTRTGGAITDHEVHESHAVKAFVVWLLHHVADSGAELMPFALFDGLSTVEEVLEKAASVSDLREKDGLCKVRLHEHSFVEVYNAYKKYGEGKNSDSFRFEILDVETVRRLFHKHPRLKHIYMARNTDQFAKCDTCFALNEEAKSTDRAIRAHAQRGLRVHYDTENCNRQDYVRRTMKPVVNEFDKTISGSLSIILDKPTKELTKLPAAAQLPKQVSSRLPNTIMGVIAHGISPYAIALPPANSDGINATCESLYATISEIQKEYTIPRVIHVQADNHSDNKCATKPLVLAWIVGMGIVDEIDLSFLVPGHGHSDLDQLFSKWLRRIIDRELRCVTHTRLMYAIKTASRRRHAPQAREISVKGIRDWKSFLADAAASRDLRRLSMSNASGEGVYQFKIKRGTNNSVGLTYKERSTNEQVYPRPFHDGETVRDDILGHGRFVDVAFDTELGEWRGSIDWASGQRTVRCAPPNAIALFDNAMPVPAGLPVFEPMRPEFLDEFKPAKAVIGRCLQSLPLLRDTPGAEAEWADYFAETEACIQQCSTDGGPWFRGEAPTLLRPGVSSISAPLTSVEARGAFLVDPITFAPNGGRGGFLDADRARLLAASGN